MADNKRITDALLRDGKKMRTDVQSLGQFVRAGEQLPAVEEVGGYGLAVIGERL